MNHLKFATAFHHGGPFFHSRCSLCPDYFAELADISLGDAWKLQLDTESGGWNAGFVRSAAAEEIIVQLRKAKRIIYNPLPAEKLIKTHASSIRTRKNLLPAIQVHERAGFRKPVFTSQPRGKTDILLRCLYRVRRFGRKRAQKQRNWPFLWMLTLMMSAFRKLNRTPLPQKEPK
jgi:hypothetical protein